MIPCMTISRAWRTFAADRADAASSLGVLAQIAVAVLSGTRSCKGIWRNIQTGAEPVSVRNPKTRSCTGKPAAFRSAPVPPQVRKAASVEAFVPWLQLKGVSSGEMSEPLQALMGPEARGFSASCVSRPAERWNGEMEQWRREDLSNRRWAYIWADGIYFGPRMSSCAPWWRSSTARDSVDSWREVLADLKGRGMSAPKLAVGDGVPGVLGGAGPCLSGHPPPVPERLWKAWQGGGRCTIQRRNRVEKI